MHSSPGQILANHFLSRQGEAQQKLIRLCNEIQYNDGDRTLILACATDYLAQAILDQPINLEPLQEVDIKLLVKGPNKSSLLSAKPANS